MSYDCRLLTLVPTLIAQENEITLAHFGSTCKYSSTGRAFIVYRQKCENLVACQNWQKSKIIWF